MMKEPGAKLGIFVHLMTVLVLLLKGFNKVTQDHLLSGITLIFLGLVILALVIFEKRLRLSHFQVRQACFMIEAFALFIVAIVFYQEGRQYLQYVFGACALAYLFAAVVHYRKHKKASH